MSRDVSTQARSSLFAQQTDEVYLCKLKISHTSWASDFHFINDRVPHTDGGGQEWIGCPFSITLPSENEDEMPQVTLAIDNVDRVIVQTLRQLSTPCTVVLEVCLASDIDDVIAGPYEFDFNAAKWNAMTVSGSLEYEPILNIRWPAHDFTPITTPGLFKA